MYQFFLENIKKNKLLSPGEKVLLAVSGGIDSVVMLDLFFKAGYNICIAHCNFKLRGDDSDKDEVFVKDLAKKYNLPIYTISFETEEYAEINNISLQMAARELRYNWFKELLLDYSYDYIATAHNKDDVVETFLINILRGTGIKGLTGIKIKSKNIIRPILFASRSQIEKYYNKNNLQFREDVSNISLKYKRNKIRHQIIPSFEGINPNFKHTVIENIQRLKEANEIYSSVIEEKRNLIVQKDAESISMEIKELKQLYPLSAYLFEFLSPYNFPGQNIEDIIDSLDGPSGKQFFSSSHRLVKDRTHLILTSLSEETQSRFYIEEGISNIKDPVDLKLRVFEKTANFKIPDKKNTAYLDYQQINFPLIIRKWQQGDYFQPLGMKDIKKVSDFFINNKLSIIEKEKTWILVSDDKIVWIIGKRIDDRFKISGDTKEILEIIYSS